MKKKGAKRFGEINKVVETYLPKFSKNQKRNETLCSSEVAENIAISLAGDFRRRLKRG